MAKVTTFKTVEEYYQLLKDFAKNLGLQGVSIEALTQILAQSLYFSEVENILYSQESSLERATQYNSKIQLCMDRMYSVYRGACPRVILNFYSQKYFSFEPYQVLGTFNKFKLYYLGYLDENTGEIIEGSIAINPLDEKNMYTIACILVRETVTFEKTLDENNSVYADLLTEGLSNDLILKMIKPGESEEFLKTYKVSRLFTEHIHNEDTVFDLTLPSFGARFYFPTTWKESWKILVTAFKLCSLDDFSGTDLKSIKLQGTIPVSYKSPSPGKTAIESKLSQYTEYLDGVYLIPNVPAESLIDIHYKANRERYMNSTLRSNSDINNIFQEYFPGKVQASTYRFEGISATTVTPAKVTLEGTWVPGNNGIIGVIRENLSPVTYLGVTYSDYYRLTGDASGVYIVKSLEGSPRYTSSSLFMEFPTEIQRDPLTKGYSRTLRILYSGDIYVNLVDSPEGHYSSGNVTEIIIEDYHKDSVVISGEGKIYDVSMTLDYKTLVNYYSSESQIEFPNLKIFYIPKVAGITLGESELQRFKEERSAYYIVSPEGLDITQGLAYRAIFDIKLGVYNITDETIKSIEEILGTYENTFNLDLGPTGSDFEEIKTRIQKIPEVKQILGLSIHFQTAAGLTTTWDQVKDNKDISYYTISQVINTVLC